MNTAPTLSTTAIRGYLHGIALLRNIFRGKLQLVPGSITKRLGHVCSFLGVTHGRRYSITSGSAAQCLRVMVCSLTISTIPASIRVTDFDRDQRLVTNFTWTTPKLQQMPMLARQVALGLGVLGHLGASVRSRLLCSTPTRTGVRQL